MPSNLLAPVIGGAIGGLILLIFVIAVIVVVSVTLVRRSGNSNKLRRMQSKDKDISKIRFWPHLCMAIMSFFCSVPMMRKRSSHTDLKLTA